MSILQVKLDRHEARNFYRNLIARGYTLSSAVKLKRNEFHVTPMINGGYFIEYHQDTPSPYCANSRLGPTATWSNQHRVDDRTEQMR